MATSNPTPNRTVYIYELSDPRTGCVRYVGKSVSPKARLATHIREAKSGNPVHSKRWIYGLLSAGVTPTLGIIEEVPAHAADEAERYWIGCLLLAGASLTNRTAGGDGQQIGYKWSADAKRRVSESLRGKKRTPEQCAAYKEAFSRPEIRERRRAMTAERMADPVARAIAMVGMSGKKMPEDAKAKISASWTAERKARHAAEKSALPVDERWKRQLKEALAARWAKYRAARDAS